LISQNPGALAKGPIALVFAEDAVEIDTTVRHNLHLGFKTNILFMPAEFDLAKDTAEQVIRVDNDITRKGNREEIVNTLIARAPSVWMYVCYNAEYLFFPTLHDTGRISPILGVVPTGEMDSEHGLFPCKDFVHDKFRSRRSA
jgi:hypothetical protein